VAVRPRMGELKENKIDHEIGGHPYRNYDPKYERKNHLGEMHLERIRSTILELHAIRYEIFFWAQFLEDKFDEVLSP